MSNIIDQPIPTNIITGFLGAGKSTLIQAFLRNKPAHERWAVLVNEFGEIGIDGHFFSAMKDKSEVFVREVPGGCMCCASGLPMQIALNQLIAKAKPHRLLIEPTGLGHPKEVMEVFAAEHYQPIIDLRATLTLVDARKLTEQRYREHATFQQQIEVADLVLAAKTDLYTANEQHQLRAYLDSLQLTDTPIESIGKQTSGLNWLDLPSKHLLNHSHAHHHAHDTSATQEQIEQSLSETGMASVCNEGEGYVSQGWIFLPQFVFSYDQVFGLLSGTEAERIKGVFITEKGVFAFNKADDILTCVEMDETEDSRVEMIGQSLSHWEGFEASLHKAIFSRLD